jgi:hypothetical protein
MSELLSQTEEFKPTCCTEEPPWSVPRTLR